MDCDETMRRGTAKVSDAGTMASPPVGEGSLYRQLRPGPGKERDAVLANQRSRLLAAMVELAAARGYQGTTVRDLVQLAGVSKASFYEQFSGKDECFLATYDAGLRAAATAVLRGESAAPAGRERLRAGLAALAELVVAQPKAARLVLIESLASTPAIRDHVRQRLGLLEELVRERLATVPGGVVLPKPLVRGIVLGISHLAGRCLRSGHPERFGELADQLLDWVLAFDRRETVALFSAAQAPVRSVATAPPEAAGGSTPRDDRDLLITATLRLAAREGYAELTPSRIRRAAGVSRRSFDSNFDDATGCFLAAVGARLDGVTAAARRAAGGGEDWAKETCLAFDRIVASLAAAPDLARLAFVEIHEAAPASLRWHEDFVSDSAELLYREAPRDRRPSPAIAGATIAVVWALLADQVRSGHPHLLPARARQLAFVALVPVLGARGALHAIEATWDAEAVAL